MCCLRGIKLGYKKSYLMVEIKRKAMELHATLSYLLCYNEHVLL